MKGAMCESVDKYLVLFAKWPIHGHVKTRMANHSSKDFALEAYLELYQASYQTISSYSSAVSDVYFDQALDESFAALFTDEFSVPSHYEIQQGDNLGERMANTIQAALDRMGRVVIIGSDCPVIDAEYLDQAFEALLSSDIVLGPAEDGGYVLIGASRFHPSIFDKVQWGTETVFAKTKENADRLGYTCHALSTRWDVDSVEDFERWKSLT